MHSNVNIMLSKFHDTMPSGKGGFDVLRLFPFEKWVGGIQHPRLASRVSQSCVLRPMSFSTQLIHSFINLTHSL